MLSLLAHPGVPAVLGNAVLEPHPTAGLWGHGCHLPEGELGSQLPASQGSRCWGKQEVSPELHSEG